MSINRVFSVHCGSISIGNMPFQTLDPVCNQIDNTLSGPWAIYEAATGVYLRAEKYQPCAYMEHVDVTPICGTIAIGDSLWYDSLLVHAVIDETFDKWREVMASKSLYVASFGALYNTADIPHEIHTTTVDGVVVAIFIGRKRS